MWFSDSVFVSALHELEHQNLIREVMYMHCKLEYTFSLLLLLNMALRSSKLRFARCPRLWS